MFQNGIMTSGVTAGFNKKSEYLDVVDVHCPYQIKKKNENTPKNAKKTTK